jgi:hypothetical protein
MSDDFDSPGDREALLLRLLADPASPRRRIFPSRGEVVIPVKEFEAFVAEQRASEQLRGVDRDELISRLGGRRTEVYLPGRKSENLLRRLVGLDQIEAEAVWRIPSSALTAE